MKWKETRIMISPFRKQQEFWPRYFYVFSCNETKLATKSFDPKTRAAKISSDERGEDMQLMDQDPAKFKVAPFFSERVSRKSPMITDHSQSVVLTLQKIAGWYIEY